jgi:hypothetical protein
MFFVLINGAVCAHSTALYHFFRLIFSYVSNFFPREIKVTYKQNLNSLKSKGKLNQSFIIFPTLSVCFSHQGNHLNEFNL